MEHQISKNKLLGVSKRNLSEGTHWGLGKIQNCRGEQIFLSSIEGDHSVVILYPHLLNVLKGFEAYIRILDGKVKHSVVKYM